MSDGPHKSLRLRKPWRELAKRGDQSVYSEEQVVEAATAALAFDFNEVKWSLLDALKAVFTGRDNSLQIVEIAQQELESAKSLAAASVFGENAVSFAIEAVREGRFGIDAYHDAIGEAAKQRGYANARATREHYLREAPPHRADRVNRRLCAAIDGLSVRGLGGAMLASREVPVRRLAKSSGLDDGVPFR